MAVVAIRRAEYTFGAAHLVAVEVPDGKVEIYRSDLTDGLEMFQGYLSDPRIPAVWRIRAVEALVAASYHPFRGPKPAGWYR